MRLITFICICFFMFPFHGYAQYFMAADHYLNNPVIINPAFAGSENALSMMLHYRNNWSGFEGAPRTMSLTAHAPIRNEKAGLGLVLLSERTGIRRETDFIGNYAYRINFDRGTLSFGLSFILSFLRTDLDKLRPDDPNDPLLDRIPEKGMQPDFSTGIYYYTDRFYLSLSAPMFLSHEYDDSRKWRIKNNLNDYNYFANTGYKFDIQKDITMTPSFLVKYFSGTTQVDLGASASFRNKLSIGAIYRCRNILVSMFQVQVNNQLRMGYSYDFNLSDRAEYRYNSNEITLRYVFEYLSDAPDPRGF